MAKIIVFNHISLDGYFVDASGDMSWAHTSDPEFNSFVQTNAGGQGRLVFGRVTYELMASYWPTPLAAQQDPVVAAGMNRLPKVVFSNTLQSADWANTVLIRGNLEAAMTKLKDESDLDLFMFGSGRMVADLAKAKLVDEYQLILNPLVLGRGRTLFEGLPEMQRLTLLGTRTFANGNLFLRYGRAGGNE